MCVWQAALLKFNGPAMCRDRPEDALVHELLQHSLELQIKDASHQIRSVDCMFSVGEVIHYFRPCRVGSKGDEIVRFPKLSHYGQCILIVHLHGTGTASEAAGQDDGTAHLGHRGICCWKCCL